MEYRILGPLEVCKDGRQVGLGGVKQRALLAILILHANEVVSVDRLVDELWDGRPPATAAKVVQVYVSQLRKALGGRGEKTEESVLVTRSPGYMIRIAPEELDATRFERFAEDGRRALRTGDADEAARALLAGLALWRGPALADFALERFAGQEIARLEEARVSALEERLEADLVLGRHNELIGEFEALISSHPLRERLRGQLMLALYRAGRQAEALAAYQDTRRFLDEQLGLEPTQALQHLEKAILVHDSALDPPAAPDTATQTGAPVRRRARWGRALTVLAVGVGLLGIGVAAVELDRGSRLATPRINSLTVIDAKSGRLENRIAVGARPTALASGAGAIWTANFDEQTLSRVDPVTRKEVARVPAGGAPTGLAVDEETVWVSHSFGSTLTRIDAGVNAISATISVGSGLGDVAVAQAAIWLVDGLGGTVRRVDPSTNGLAGSLAVGGSPRGLVLGAGALWVADGRSVVRIDPKTRRVVSRIALRFRASRLSVGAGSVWVSNNLDNAVSRIDIATGSAVETIPVGRGPVGVAAGRDAVWVANSLDGTVSKIDPATNRVVKTVRVGGRPEGVIVTSGSVWVTVAPP